MNDSVAVDDFLGLVNATWSVNRIRARVVAAICETAGARTLLLQPNRLWPGHRAGQHLSVDVEIDGRRHRRTFSIASAPREDGLLAVTVQEREGGRVSRWWNRQACVGDVVTLGPPRGVFTLPATLPPRLFLISAGSGITPVMALLRDVQRRQVDTSVCFVHCARTAADVIFANELAAAAVTMPHLDVRLHLTQTRGRLSAADFNTLAAAADDAPTFVCGPIEFAAQAQLAWDAVGQSDRLVFESFGVAPQRHAIAAGHEIRAVRSGTAFTTAGTGSLLHEAETAGLAPAYGCRAGICQTCKCRKLDGVVVDLRTGAVCDEPNQMIQLCITAARSALTLDV